MSSLLVKRPSRDIVEIFGHEPDDLTPSARTLWRLGACPFTKTPCIKGNHDRSVIYGTCSVSDRGADCIICPNRLYGIKDALLQRVCVEAFGNGPEYVSYGEYVERRSEGREFAVALGQNSGGEVKIGRDLSMDWVIARVSGTELLEYVGIEVQSIDITGNYRDNWYAYKDLPNVKASGEVVIPPSEHGLNWANVHKRLIPQIIRKGRVYSSSTLVRSGLYFIVPDVVFQRFERVIGSDYEACSAQDPSTITIHTYELGERVGHGHIRKVVPVRTVCVNLDEFAQRFITGHNLPTGKQLDDAVCGQLGVRSSA